MKQTAKKRIALFTLCAVLLCGSLLLPEVLSPAGITAEAEALSVGDRVDGGVVVAADGYYCNCCHEHNHPNNVFGKLGCVFCKITQIFKRITGKKPGGDHVYQITSQNAPTCTADGVTALRCAKCGDTKRVTEAKLGHSIQKRVAKPATCTEKGWYAYEYCVRCDYTTYREIPATGHVPGETRKLDEIPATCTGNGSYRLVTACTVCGQTIEDKTVVVPATGHTVVTDPAVEATCGRDGKTEGSHCAVCGAVLTAQETVPTTGHDFADGAAVTDLTTGSGVKATYVCRFCGETQTNAAIDAAAAVGGYGRVWHTLEAAVAAVNGETVYLLRDTTLENDLTLTGVTLVIPCEEQDVGYYTREDDGNYPFYCPDNSGTAVAPARYRTLTVPAGKTLRVGENATLLVNAVTGQKKTAGENYGVTGNYAEIALQGDIHVENGGVFDCAGCTTGDGRVTVKNGGTLYETYGLVKFRGGAYAYAALSGLIFPIDEYEMNAVQTPLTLEAGGLLSGTVKAYASGAYHYCHFPQVGTSDALLLMSDGASLERLVRGEKSVYKFTGNVAFSETKLKIAGSAMSTANGTTPYKMNGNVQLEFYHGTVSMARRFAFLPGFNMVVGEGATLNTTARGFGFFATADDCDWNGTSYPGFYGLDSLYASASRHYTAGRSDAALYVLDGGKVTGKGLFVGRIYTDEASSYSTTNSASSGSIYVARGEVTGDANSYSVGSSTFTLPVMRETLRGDALANARAMLGLD